MARVSRLTSLNLYGCSGLTGALGIWGNKPARNLTGRCLGTLAPLTGLSQLRSLELGGYGCQLEGQFLVLYGNNQGLTGLVETGDLQPLQNLNQLTTLNLDFCRNLTGQSVSEIVRAQPDHEAPLFVRDGRGIEPTATLMTCLMLISGTPGLTGCWSRLRNEVTRSCLLCSLQE